MNKSIKILLCIFVFSLICFLPKKDIKAATPKTKITASSKNYTIRLKKPSSLSSSNISTSDDYYNRRLVIKIKGNYKSYYKKKKNRYIKDKSFRSYKVSYKNGYTRVYIKPRKGSIKGYAITLTSKYIYIKYTSPKKMYKNIVVIDAGHGGSDDGAVGNGYKEKNLTLSIVLAARNYFNSNPNYKVYYTRQSDTYPSLTARSTLANKVGADRFISVHINSFKSTSKGTETLYNSKGYKSSTGLTSYKWSKSVHPYIVSATGFTDRGLVNRTGLAVLRNTKTSSTLTEFGFISNKKEAKSMSENTDQYGKAVYNAIIASFSKNPTKR